MKFWQPKEGESARLVFIDPPEVQKSLIPAPKKVAFRCFLCDMGYPVTHGFQGLYGKPIEIPDPDE